MVYKIFKLIYLFFDHSFAISFGTLLDHLLLRHSKECLKRHLRLLFLGKLKSLENTVDSVLLEGFLVNQKLSQFLSVTLHHLEYRIVLTYLRLEEKLSCCLIIIVGWYDILGLILILIVCLKLFKHILNGLMLLKVFESSRGTNSSNGWQVVTSR